MTITPEQLAKWREDAARAYMADDSVNDYVRAILAYEFGYLRAKQEDEQIMKLAKFGAMVAASHMSGDLLDGDDFTDGMLAIELLIDVEGNTKFVDGIESTIMEILK